MTGRFEQLYEVCIYNGEGFTERDYFQVRDIVISSQPDYWRLFQPNEIFCFFRMNKGGQERGELLISKIHELKSNSALFQSLGAAGNQQRYIVDVSASGEIAAMPIGGGTVSTSYNDAKRDSLA
jgi:hypothetical protein